MDLEDRTIVITGAAGGLGRKMAEVIAREKAQLALVDLDKAELAKAGVSAITVTWAKELARYSIRVGGIVPGFCDTRMVANIPPKIRDKIISTSPLRRLAEPEEIARAALFILQNDFYDAAN